MRIKLYVDMDGVLSDFDAAFRSINGSSSDRVKFRKAVMENKIFRDLNFMPDTEQLLNHLKTLKDIDIEILTSVGTYDPFVGQEVKNQKTKWLKERNINYKPNFVRSKAEKATYALNTSMSYKFPNILIDDSTGCIDPFNAAGGRGILHKTAAETITLLDTTILQINSTNTLRA
jgi:5'(3')-deoxyribonucleotidase